MRVLALDPGGVTGFSEWTHEQESPLERFSFGVITGGLDGFIQSDLMYDLIFSADRVICEKYKLDGRTPDPDLTPTYVEGALKSIAWGLDRPSDFIVWQTTDMKAMVRDQILKDSGLWVTGSQVGWEDGRDVNDTAIHALAWAKSIDHQPTIAHYWPDN